MLYVFILIFLVLIYILFFTPYPFVWLLRSKKSSSTEKGPENIKEIKNTLTIELGNKVNSKLDYDMYLPKDKNFTDVIVWLHGGAFVAGDSNGMRNYGPMMAHEGYAVFAMNYTHAPRKSFPTQVKQVDEMIEHIKELFPEENLNFILGGDSAGANIAASYASIHLNNSLLEELDLKFSLKDPIKGLLLYCGPYDFTEDYTREEFKEFKTFMKYIGWSYLGKRNWEKSKQMKQASPLLNIHPQFPPSYIVDGKKFSFMWQGIKMVDKLESMNIKVKSRFYPELPHEFQFDYKKYPIEATQVYEDSVEFLSSL